MDVKCGAGTMLADDDPSKTFCPEHCPDHENYDGEIIDGWPTCANCGGFAPEDHYDDY